MYSYSVYEVWNETAVLILFYNSGVREKHTAEDKLFLYLGYKLNCMVIVESFLMKLEIQREDWGGL